jgi:hypothetical protein
VLILFFLSEPFVLQIMTTRTAIFLFCTVLPRFHIISSVILLFFPQHNEGRVAEMCHQHSHFTGEDVTQRGTHFPKVTQRGSGTTRTRIQSHNFCPVSFSQLCTVSCGEQQVGGDKM